MKTQRFFLILLATLLVALLIIFVSDRIPSLVVHKKFLIGSLVLLTLFAVIYYFGGLLTKRSKNIYHFTRFSIVMSMIKIICSGIFIYVYHAYFHPINDRYVFIFFIYYLLFSIIEVLTLRSTKIVS